MLQHLIFLAGHHQQLLPNWLQTPSWLLPGARAIRSLVTGHPGLGLLVVIFCEELGIPLPIPGDVAILSSGYLVSIGRLPYLGAVAAVMGGAISGSFILFSLSGRYGHRFLTRYGKYIGLDGRRLARAEGAFRRWGPWAIIIGRQIPGMRVILSALAGSFGMEWRVFVPSVAISSAIWAISLIEVGRLLGRRSFGLFRLVPGHLLPYLAIAIGLLVVAYHVWERRRAARRERAGAPDLVES